MKRLLVRLAYIFTILLVVVFGIVVWYLDEKQTDEYLAALNCDNAALCSEAMYYLGEEEDTNAVLQLIAIVQRTNALNRIRIEAIDALGKIGDTSAIPALVAQLSCADKTICKSAIDALGRIGDKAAVEPLVEALSDRTVRLHAIRALGGIGSTNAVAPLTALLLNEDKYVRYNANQSLKSIGEAK